ncbi:PepSY domain-containing protein [Roseibium polysiphoniae]|uniref:PepSY domain-containing protein n=1 Tax=Roseibium polysiphoniae TaxID=2571221 RepID=A0A944GVG3_9HYPH|nr:PepSY domain-containing protein [Roseibium polysiphoniae]MBS8262420.1 PepSY domain-containing protein [Roseibium polysiphoniae]
MSTSNPNDVGAVRAATSVAIKSPFYLAAWRWHFYAGLFVIPFLTILAITGLTMMYIGYFDGRDGGYLKIPIQQNAIVLSVSEQADNALAAIPGSKMVEWLKARGPENPSVFRVKAEDGAQSMVAVNPYTGEVVDTWPRRSGWYDFADGIHSDLMMGTTGDSFLEIAAGLSIVMIITGLYLWWPRDGSFLQAFVPNLKASGRALWQGLHTVIGVYVSVFLLLFLITGMSWTGVWGSKIMQAWSTFPAEKWDNVPLSDDTHASMNHAPRTDVPWALEQTPMPASGSGAGTVSIASDAPVTVDSVAALAHELGFNARYRVSYPSGENGVWTINQDTMSADAEDPFSDRTVHIDRYTGNVLASVAFADYSLAGKAMAVGTPFHMGLMGLWNLVLNTFVCLSVIFLSVSGVVMWWMRRPAKSAVRLFAPRVPENRPHWRGAMLVMLIVSLAFPLAGLALIVALALDILVLSRIPALRSAFA